MDRAREHRSRAARALQSHGWSNAEQALRAYLVIEPNDAIAWNNLGVALEHQAKQKEAVEAYAQAARLMPRGGLPASNLIREMQRYLGFVAAIAIWRTIDFGLQFLPIPSGARTVARLAVLALLVLGAFAFYVRRRDELPEDAWRAYKSAMARTRQLRYGGVAFVLIGFLIFAAVLFAITLVPGGVSDATVVLVVVAGLLWLLVAQRLWRQLVRPFFESRMK